MNEQDKILKEALADNVQFKSERADALRKECSTEFRNKLKFSERIMWIYLLVCVLVAIPTLNLFEASTDFKTLITCVLGLLVVYETTVLLKLWYVVAGTKLSVLKEMKQLRLEVSQLATAAGVDSPADVLSAKYEPVRGTSKLERRAWIIGLVIAGFLAGSVSGGGYVGLLRGDNKLVDDSFVTLASDGSATSVTKITQTRSGSSPWKRFSFHAPESWKVRWVDSHGREMPFETTPPGSSDRKNDTHTRYQVSIPPGAQYSGRFAYTRMAEIPVAATQSDDVWTYASDAEYGFGQNEFTTTVLLPEGVVVVSTEPKPTLEFTSGGKRAVRFEGTRAENRKFAISIQYRLAAEADE